MIRNWEGTNTIQVYEMRSAPGVQRAKDYFANKNAGKPWNEWEAVTHFKASFGLNGLRSAGLNATQQFVGSFRVDIYPNADHTINIVLTNPTSFTSFLYGKGPSWNSGFGRTQTQIYHWRETWQ